MFSVTKCFLNICTFNYRWIVVLRPGRLSAAMRRFSAAPRRREFRRRELRGVLRRLRVGGDRVPGTFIKHTNLNCDSSDLFCPLLGSGVSVVAPVNNLVILSAELGADVLEPMDKDFKVPHYNYMQELHEELRAKLRDELQAQLRAEVQFLLCSL